MSGRKVWKFPLRIVSDCKIDKNIIDTDFNNHIDESEQDIVNENENNNGRFIDAKTILDDLKRKIEGKSNNSNQNNRKPGKRKVTSTVYYRDPDIMLYSKIRANGICQLCRGDAPFIDKNGIPFLENHHIEYLENGGEDSILNTCAVCCNCHAKIHHYNNDETKQKLLNMIEIIEQT